MALKALVASLDEVAEEHKSLYTEKEGKFVLEVDGLVPKERLDEFRNSNVQLRKEGEQLKATADKFKDIDPEKAREAEKKLKEIEEKNLLDKGNIEEVVNQRTAIMRQEHESQMKAKDKAVDAEKTRADTAETALSRLLIDGAIRDAASPHVKSTAALEDVLLRGQKIWRLEEGKAVPRDAKGEIIYGRKGDQLTMEEWVGLLQSEAGHLFKESSGGGAKGSGSSSGGG